MPSGNAILGQAGYSILGEGHTGNSILGDPQANLYGGHIGSSVNFALKICLNKAAYH